jgi:prolyl oligopeptidase
VDPNLDRTHHEAVRAGTPRTDAPTGAANENAAGIVYPHTRWSDQVDDCHGILVADPYRWLEDANSVETRQWVEAQNQTAFRYLAAIPGRDRIKDRLTRLWDYEKYSIPFKEANRVFYFMNSGLQNQSVLFVAASLQAEPRVLLDPNALSADGTVALSGLSVSRDGRFLAYSLSTAGSDWQGWRVRAIESGEDLADHIRFSKFSGVSWTHDSQGFFYSRYEEPKASDALQQQNLHQKLYYHRLGTPQAQDPLVYQRPDQPHWLLHGSVTDDGRYLVIEARPGTEPITRLFINDLRSPQHPLLGPETPITPLAVEGDGRYEVIGNDGPVFFVMTDRNAPRNRVVAIDMFHASPSNWREILPQAEDILDSVHLVGDRLLASYLKDAHSAVRIFGLDGTAQGEVALPGIGTASGFEGKRADTETFYSYSSFSTPPIVFRYDIASGVSEVFRKTEVAFNAFEYETTQVFYSSKDGTRVPMFLTHKKGVRLDGANPVLLHAYGGFHASMTPSFSASRLVWMEIGGIYAQANLRGGGEYGQEWHDAGRKQNKQNVFDDFIAAAEWLIENGYTSRRKLAIQGGSNGGLLVGACMTQRPDLFGAALPAVGVMDMVRFHKFTIGWAWKSDYGDPDVAEDFKTLYAYSPLHNIRPGTPYPPTLVTTSDHDDRVVPCHSYKFAAALQAAQAAANPVLIRIETQAGHGAGKPTAKIIEEVADQWAFLTHALEMDVPQVFA